MRGGVRRRGRVVVRDKVAQMAVFLLADGGFQRDRLLGDPHDLPHLVHRHAHLLGDLLRRWAHAQFLCSSWRLTFFTLLMVSTMCTGMRMVRAWSAMARVMAWRIHQVA